MSSSKTPLTNLSSTPVSDFQYRQMMPTDQALLSAVTEQPSPVSESESFGKDLLHSFAAEYAAASAQAEARIRDECETRIKAEEARVSRVIADFEHSRKVYFAKVELEVVQLALAIAGKILHRESQVDPMLVAALVQIAFQQLKEGSVVSIRVRPEETKRWREHFSSLPLKLSVSVIEDSDLTHEDCFLETELGSVNFSLQAQLKEVQQGFFDVLAQKPKV